MIMKFVSDLSVSRTLVQDGARITFLATTSYLISWLDFVPLVEVKVLRQSSAFG